MSMINVYRSDLTFSKLDTPTKGNNKALKSLQSC